MERRFDDVSGSALEMLSALAPRYPEVVTSEFMDDLDNKINDTKSKFSDRYETAQFCSDSLQKSIASLAARPPELISEELLAGLEKAMDRIFKMIERQQAEIEDKIARVEAGVNRIPDLRDAAVDTKLFEESADEVSKVFDES